MPTIFPVPRIPSAIRQRKRTDPLSSTLASGALARLVLYFATRPEEPVHEREIQRRTGLTPRSLNTELVRLQELGVVRRRPDGHLVRYELVEESPRWRALRMLAQEMADPADVLRAALADLPGVQGAFIFGSMARGDARDDSDLDLFILDGGVPEDLLARRTLEAGVLLRREVSVVQMSAGEMAARIANGSGFLAEVMRGAKRWIRGDENSFLASVPLA